MTTSKPSSASEAAIAKAMPTPCSPDAATPILWRRALALAITLPTVFLALAFAVAASAAVILAERIERQRW